MNRPKSEDGIAEPGLTSVEVVRFSDSGSDIQARRCGKDDVVRESEVAVTLNGTLVCRLECSPKEVGLLAVGHLLTEGHMGIDSVVARLEESPNEGVVSVWVTQGNTSTYCHNDSRQVSLLPGVICDLMDGLLDKSLLFKLTGAVHAAALCQEGVMVGWQEDISRHNAIDKVIGQAFVDGRELSAMALATTGRINLQVVKKVASVGIKAIMSKAPPTDKAVRLARDLGITVIGFVRGRRFTVYAHPERVVGSHVC